MSEDTSDANATAKSFGHRRQPALGKAMPVTALLFNMPKSNELRASHMRGGGGEYATDEQEVPYEQPPRFFDVDECQEDKDCAETVDEVSKLEQAFELLVSECSSSSGSEHETTTCGLENANEEHNNNDNNKEEGGHALAGCKKGSAYKPCLRCTHNAPGDLGMRACAINEMCQRLCTDECRLRLSLAGFVPPTSCGTYDSSLSTPPPTAIPRQPALTLQRKKFLTVGLTTASDTSDSDFSASADANVTTAAASAQMRTPLTQRELHAAIMLDLFNDSATSSPLAHDLTALKDFREKHDEVAEALVKTSAMTSTSRMRQRLAARKLEMEIDLENAGINVDVDVDFDVAGGSRLGVANVKRDGDVESSLHASTNAAEYVPPRDLLLYLVRMGSFNSAPRINNVDSEDDNFELPQDLSLVELLEHVRGLHGVEQPPLLKRCFLRQQTFPLASASTSAEETTSTGNDDISDVLRCLDLDKVSQHARNGGQQNQIRIFQWNVLSQTLGQHNDGFVCCPETALTWQNRKYLIVQEILQTQPDVVCLQEVDHFKFLEKILGTQQYDGIFFPKPDSPCLYIDDNNGPDGCAIFYRRDKFKLKQFETRILEVWRVQSNQVAIALMLEMLATGREFCVCTTHLKARKGSLLAKLRNEQGRDLIRFVKNFAGNQPVLLCGDFNAEPSEPIYTTILSCDILNLGSAYADMKLDAAECLLVDKSENNGADLVEDSIKREPVYTTWKIREQGEECHTIDYVFYTREQFKVKNCLGFPQPEEIGENRTPSHQYPSDHFSLVCDFEILPPLADQASQASQSSRLHV